MIVWINGPFGVGKSTTSALLAAAWPQAIEFDPEILGYVLRRWQPDGLQIDDFQDLSVWRCLVRETAAGLIRDFSRPLIVAMTLLNAEYFDEIIGGLRRDGVDVRSFCLVASKELVLRRVSERGDVTSWIPDKYDEYAAALSDPRFGVSIDTTERSPEAVLDAILQALPRPLPQSAPLP